MNTVARTEPDGDALAAQLFRYAQDLEELMRQHNRLLGQHRMLLQSVGQPVHDEDLLPQLLANSQALHWVTDCQAHVVRVGPPQPGTWSDALDIRAGYNLLELVDREQGDVLRAQLRLMADRGANANTVQLLLQLAPTSGLPQGLALDLLLMPLRNSLRPEVIWFVLPAAPQDASDLQAQGAFINALSAEPAVVATTPFGRIHAVSPGFCQMTGYRANELLERNPRMLASGRHDAAFYQDMWLQLLDTGSWSGTIFNRRKDGQIYLQWQTIRMVADAHGQVLSYLSAAIDLSYTAPAVKRLESIASTDPLTGLPNRRMLTQRLTLALEAAQPQEQALALLFIDLDRFKPVNDELGHAVGDQVLQEVARRMRQALLPGDLLARVGGDEFVVLLQGTQRVAAAESVGGQLQAALAPPMELQQFRLKLAASIGCARYPQDGNDMVELMQHADAAMYGSKRFGIPFCNYDAGLDQTPRPNLEFDLWQALDRGEISLVYQPQVHNGPGRRLRGVEALMRWKHPVLGEVDPVQFISLAESSGAIVPLGTWALGEACSQLRRWRDAGLPQFSLSFNISLRQLRHPGLLAEVQHALQDNQIEPGQLELELSEAQAMLFVQGDTRHVQALRKLGVRIAIDDYGISFSSLTRLNFLSISSFKINAQSVHEIMDSADARAIGNCMIAIGRAMGIEVIAQGVETAGQADWLEEQGCHVLQGFHTGHPLPAHALPDWLAQA